MPLSIVNAKYKCFPSVVCVGKSTEITITPRDTSRRFLSDKTYELSVVGMRDDSLSYHAAIPFNVPCSVYKGCLKFTYTFDREQEYSIRFREVDSTETRIPLYAVKEDLYQLRPLKGDLHTHTYYSDGRDGITATPADYRENGYDFFALTDHNRMYTSKLAQELYEDVSLGMHIMNGEEVHTPPSIVHIVHAGGKESVAIKYVKDIETYKQEVKEIEKTLVHIDEKFRERVAMAKWACDEIHKAGGIAIFAHPFWAPNRYNVSEDLCKILFEEKLFDAFEVAGGVLDHENMLQASMWHELALNGINISPVGSSDSHNHVTDGEFFGRRFTIVFAKDNTTEDILDAVRNGLCVAAECTFTDDINNVRFHSTSYRLVSYTNFLFRNYFTETYNLCVGEGVLMRRYARGEDVGALLNALAGSVKSFYEQFFGLAPAPTVSEKQAKFLDKCMEIQMNDGPLTIGSSITPNTTNPRKYTRRL